MQCQEGSIEALGGRQRKQLDPHGEWILDTSKYVEMLVSFFFLE